MDNSQKKRRKARKRRVMQVRKKVRGTKETPRLSVSKTNHHIYAQLIDDEAGMTLVGFGTQSKGANIKRKSKEAAQMVGRQIAELAKERNIQAVVFDRGRFRFHGLIAELAMGAREVGLQF